MTMTIGFVGMTHLGLVTSIAASNRGHNVVCFDQDNSLITKLNEKDLPINEPYLDKALNKNFNKIQFTSEVGNLDNASIVYVCPDIKTNNQGTSDLSEIKSLLEYIIKNTQKSTVIVILSQVNPGFTREYKNKFKNRKIYYQVETLVFGIAFQRSMFPERFIVGCDDPNYLDKNLKKYLKSYDCPILKMRYESAELAKISINMFLVSSVTTSNMLAEICESIGADWDEIIPSLRLDKRIGEYAYLKPGLGISGGNLERDLASIKKISVSNNTDARLITSWTFNSKYRKAWPYNILKKENIKLNSQIGILGLSYKENTHSVKNSPSIFTIKLLSKYNLKVYDPVVNWDTKWHKNTFVCKQKEDVLEKIDVLMILTPWPEFYDKKFLNKILKNLKNKLIIDPYNIIYDLIKDKKDIKIYTLGK